MKSGIMYNKLCVWAIGSIYEYNINENNYYIWIQKTWTLSKSLNQIRNTS